MWLALSVHVITEVDNDVPLVVEFKSILVSIISERQSILDHHCSFACKSTAGVVSLDGLLVLSFKELGLIALYSSFSNLPPSHQANSETRALIERIGLI